MLAAVRSWAIAQRLRYVSGGDLGEILEVGDGASDFQHSVIPACGQTEALGRGLQEHPRFRMYRRVRIEPATDRVGVARDSRLSRESAALRGAGAFDPPTN